MRRTADPPHSGAKLQLSNKLLERGLQRAFRSLWRQTTSRVHQQAQLGCLLALAACLPQVAPAAPSGATLIRWLLEDFSALPKVLPASKAAHSSTRASLRPSGSREVNEGKEDCAIQVCSWNVQMRSKWATTLWLPDNHQASLPFRSTTPWMHKSFRVDHYKST